jgi:3-phenylpropionate/trans-cinnamate dioxygenase ferredoxin reductase subunit
MEEYKYVIVGGGLAGGSAVDAIRQVDAEGSLVLVTQEPYNPYHRPPLSKGFLMGQGGREKVYLRSADHYARNNVDLLVGMRATGLSPDRRLLTLDDGRTLKYERLLLATGGRARRLSIPGNDLPGVFALRSIEDSEGIRDAAREGKRALILGGSFIGSEVASSLSQMGTQVTMVFPGQRQLERIAPRDLSGYLQALYADHGVRILPETTAERLEGRDAVEWAVLNNGQTLDVDLVVMGVGIELNTELAGEAGLEVDETGGVVIDETLSTSNAFIYAAGDIAVWPDPTFGRRLHVEHWDVAKNQGIRAGRNMAGEVEPYTTLPYFFSDLFDLSFEVWGNLDSWDETILRGSLEEGSFAFFYFDDGRMVGVLAVDRPDEERDAMQDLVRRRPALDTVAARLRQEPELRRLVEALP